MATTSIEWTERSWNFLAGCSIHSPGCANCYAMRQAARIERMNPDLAHYQGLTQPSKAGAVWTGKVAYAGDHKLTEPLRVRKPTMWFVNSMSDLFHEDVPDAIIDKAFAVMAGAPQHTFQVLTKRSARMRAYVGNLPNRDDLVARQAVHIWGGKNPDAIYDQVLRRVRMPLPNVWLGVSVEDQKRADERIPDLLATPAAVRWVSAEPLLGRVDLENVFVTPRPRSACVWDVLRGVGGAPARLGWVVVGGESGPGARPMHPDWARSLRDQCAAAGVPFFFKQWGSFAEGGDRYETSPLSRIVRGWTGSGWNDDPGTWVQPHAYMVDVGKARAGRLLDGVEHNAMPEARA